MAATSPAGTSFATEPIRRSNPTRVSCLAASTGLRFLVPAMYVRANSVASSRLGTTYVPARIASLSSLSFAILSSLTLDDRGNWLLIPFRFCAVQAVFSVAPNVELFWPPEAYYQPVAGAPSSVLDSDIRGRFSIGEQGAAARPEFAGNNVYGVGTALRQHLWRTARLPTTTVSPDALFRLDRGSLCRQLQ